jgi:hypothetical protein
MENKTFSVVVRTLISPKKYICQVSPSTKVSELKKDVTTQCEIPLEVGLAARLCTSIQTLFCKLQKSKSQFTKVKASSQKKIFWTFFWKTMSRIFLWNQNFFFVFDLLTFPKKNPMQSKKSHES